MSQPNQPSPADPSRRTFLSVASSVAMGGGLLASYGTFGAYAARYLYPAGDELTAWLFVTQATKLNTGDAIRYQTPKGASVTIARQADTGSTEDFIALSSTCPHLGCRVHWEANHHRFFCPCHNGVFDPQGRATEGPPAEAGQSLARYPLKIEAGLLYIQVPLDDVT